MNPNLDLLILKTLERGPNHGFGITLHIQEASSGLLSVEEGSLYPALHRLERSGLVSAAWATTGNSRKAKYYTITDRGQKRLAEVTNAWESTSKGINRFLKHA